MHIGGTAQTGSELAAGVAAVRDVIKAIRKIDPNPASEFSGHLPKKTGEIHVSALQAILGAEPSEQWRVSDEKPTCTA